MDSVQAQGRSVFSLVGKHLGSVSKRFLIGLVAVPLGIFALVVLFATNDLFSGLVGQLLMVLIGLLSLGIYFLPTIKAFQEKKTNRQAILVLNRFLGWTLIGWVVALVWAFTKQKREALS